MRLIQCVYMVLAVVGIAVPWYFNVQFAALHEGISLAEFFSSAMSAGPASASLTVDIAIVYLAFAVWCVVEAKRWG